MTMEKCPKCEYYGEHIAMTYDIEGCAYDVYHCRDCGHTFEIKQEKEEERNDN